MGSIRRQVYVTQKIGPKRSTTPEGFLLCEEVPVARTGMMIYGPDETPVKAGPEGVVKIFREEADVFSPATIASASGKPVVNDHPDEDVVPENWQQLACGIMLNPRRGDAVQDDLLLADLLITTPEGIKAVESGKCEVSLGYDADYEETGPGVGKQSNIIINHVALVEQGRCGPRCAIGDKKLILEKEPTVKKNKFVDALRRAFKAKDATELEAIENEVKDEFGETIPAGASGGEGGDTHIHVHAGDNEEPSGRASFTDDQIQEFMESNAAEHEAMRAEIEELRQRLDKIAGAETEEHGRQIDAEEAEMMEQIKDEVPEEVAEQAAKAQDSAYLADSFQDTVAMAEVLVPGIRIPTFDRAAKPGQSFKKICGLRRQALDLAYAQPATRSILDELLSGKALDTRNMTCDAVRTLFRGAAAARRAMNNAGGAHSSRDTGAASSKAVTLAEINRRNRERYPS